MAQDIFIYGMSEWIIMEGAMLEIRQTLPMRKSKTGHLFVSSYVCRKGV
jgi:hypothetical protein